MNKTDITNEIAEKLNTLIHDSSLKTPEKAKQVANHLLRRGVQPTWRLIREILGTGSAATLQQAVNQYWKDLGQHLDHLEKRPELPKALVLECNALWDKALNVSEKTLEKRLKSAFDDANRIKETVNAEKELLVAQLDDAKERKNKTDTQLQQLKKAYHQQEIELETMQKKYQTLKVTLQENEDKFTVMLNEQQQVDNERYQELQNNYALIEKQLLQAEHALATEKSQQIGQEKHYQKALNDAKQDRQLELTRQAKQYDSMIAHYANEIGHFKIKLDEANKQYNTESKQWQTQKEKNIIAMSELQSQLAMLTQANKQLKKENASQADDLAVQKSELLQINQAYIKLKMRIELLEKP